MPVRMLNFLKEPPPRKKYPGGKIVNTPEWQDFCMSLGAGLKPHEYVTISFPKEHEIWKQMSHPISAFMHAAKQKITELRLPYDCYSVEQTIYIVGRGVIA